MKRTTAYLIGAALVAISLSACSATGEHYKPTVEPRGTSQIVVYHGGGTKAASVSFNGASKCKLELNGFFVEHVTPNKPLTISAKVWGDFVSVARTIEPRSGHSYYIRITHEASKSIIAGVLPALLMATPQFSIEDGNQSEALTKRGSC